MTCGCKVVGFGVTDALPSGTLKCLISDSWQTYSPGSTPPANAEVCYISDGTGNLYPYQPKQPPWNQVPTVTVTASAFINLFKNFTQSASAAWRQSSLQGTNLNAQSVGLTLNNMALKVSPNVSFWNYTGPAQYSSAMQTLSGMAWVLSKGWLTITKQGAALLQSNDIDSGVIPPSFWMMYGKPIAVMAAVLTGAALAEGGVAAAGAGSGTLAPTTISSAGSGLSLAQPISLGTLAPISSDLVTIAPVGAAGVAGSSGILAGAEGTLGTVAQAGGSVLKTAGVLQQLSALGKTPAQGAVPISGPVPSTRTAQSPSVLIGLIAAVGLGALFLLH